MKRVRRETAAPRRKRSLHPGVASVVAAGVMVAGLAGPLFAPAPTEAAGAQPASLASVRTVAYSTPLEAARPAAGLVRQSPDGSGGADGSGCVSGVSDGTQVCVLPTKPTSTSTGSTGAAKAQKVQQAGTGSSSGSSSSDDESDNPIKLFTKMFVAGAGAVSDVAKAATSGFTAASDVAKLATAALPVVGPLITAAAAAL